MRSGGVEVVAVRQLWWRHIAVFWLCITVLGGAGARLSAQGVTAKAPLGKAAGGGAVAGVPAAPGTRRAQDSGAVDGEASSSTVEDGGLPDGPSFPRGAVPRGAVAVGAAYPVAEEVPERSAMPVVIESATQQRADGHVVLDGGVLITYGSFRVEADHIDYAEESGDMTATGHVRVRGGKAAEELRAARGTLNVRDETGDFFDVAGSVGLKTGGGGRVYTVGNPFLFQGREVVKNGPADFEIYDGSVTSCQLAQPDWRLTSAHFAVHDGKASARGTMFKLRNVPVLYLPFVTHPVPAQGADPRQSGVLIPVVGQSSTKGWVLGEQIYFVLGRSTDLTIGSEYFSRRGWQQSGTLRYKGPGLDFFNAHFSNLLDRGFQGSILSQGPGGTVVTRIGTVNQGGEDFLLDGRKDFSAHTRVAGDAEYLSKYAYRQAFTDNFNQAVATDIVSSVYGTHERNGFVAALAADRYQGLKRTLTNEQVRILHTPTLDLDAMERRLGQTPFLWSGTFQSSGLKRTQGTDANLSLANTGLIERVDVRPELSLPVGFDGFRLRSSVAVRETFYKGSRTAVPLPGPAVPGTRSQSLNRATLEAEVELRAPVLERTFDGGPLTRLLGRTVKHTVEPEVHYRYVTGVSDFRHTLRFDVADVVSDTNELEYGVTQRLFLRPSRVRACDEAELATDAGVGTATALPVESPAGIDPAPAATAIRGAIRSGNSIQSVGITASALKGEEAAPTCGGTRESLRWRIVQRFYGNDTFGKGVLVNGRRNVLATTLDLSGVAFLTAPRSFSPIVSEMRLSATQHLDVEWDMNYDTQVDKFTQSNVFLNFHAADYFGGVSYARLNAPGRFQRLDTAASTSTTSLLSDFSQFRFLFGYGTPTKEGLSVATNVGLDLTVVQPQYGALQVAYNWNCCGISAEYRKFELGSVRNENSYRFNFTLANIGTAGNLRRAERLF